MRLPRPVLGLLLCAALATAGLAVGAAQQEERHLAPDLQSQYEAQQRGAASSPVPLTALAVAAGAGLAAALLSRRPARARIAGAAAVLAGTYLLNVLAQMAWPAAQGIELEALRTGRFSVSLLVFQGAGLPSVFLAPMAVLAGALLACAWGLRSLHGQGGAGDGGRADGADPAALLRRHLAASALALPFLAVAAAGQVRLVSLLSGPTATGPAYAILSLAALACLGLAATLAWKGWHLAAVARDPLLAPVAREAWQGLGRVEMGLCALLGVLACAGILLPKGDIVQLAPGLAFAVSLRSHTLFLLLLAVPLAPMLVQGPRTLQALRARAAPAGADAPAVPPWLLPVAAAAAVAGALAAAWFLDGALWAWAAAGLAAALPALRAGPAASALALPLPAFALWAAGNTHAAVYDSRQPFALEWAAPGPGMLALLRLAGALLAGLALARAVRALDRGAPASTAIPLGVLSTAAGAGIALLELPFSIWTVSTFRGQSVALGSLVAKQDPAVAAIMHGLCFALLGALAWALARRLRPDWFSPPPPRPVAAAVPRAARA